MKHKKFLQKFLNTQMKKRIESIFGKDSNIFVNNLSFVRSKNSYLINVTLYLSELENFDEVYPTGLTMIIEQAWGVVGDSSKNVIVQTSVDLVQ